jgi:hypothetical protein
MGSQERIAGQPYNKLEKKPKARGIAVPDIESHGGASAPPTDTLALAA